MTFDDYSYPATIAGRPFTVRVTSTALHALWGEHSGPQDAAGLVAANREMIEDIVAEKYARGGVDHGEIVIADVDLDM
ncbi:DUF1488 family protein [Sphingomonas adhaesiva]|uniref:DUF1488 family protein n=1 Tax=Sphingomonas adhaesiva TaxID=28212 RepID=UPI002FFB5263